VLAFVDVNGLSQVNDRHRRAAAALLQGLVAAIAAHLRSHDPIVRVGGGELPSPAAGRARRQRDL